VLVKTCYAYDVEEILNFKTFKGFGKEVAFETATNNRNK
jgi:hypothetical protein